MHRYLGYATLLLLMAAAPARAQVSFNWNEFFKQRKTELKYLGQQVVELQAYLEFVKAGYRIVDQGNKLIKQAKNGEFDLHDLFYLSLKLVNQQVKNYPAVRATIEHHQYVASTSAALLRKSKTAPLINSDDSAYVERTISELRSDMSASLDELMEVLSDHTLEMTDAERIAKIESLETYARQRVVFIKSFYTHVMATSIDRTRESADNSVLRKLHGIR